MHPSRLSEAPAVWRLFVAIVMTEPVCASLARAQTRLGRCGARVRWVRPDVFHLTLVFLGEGFASRVPSWRDALDVAVREVPPFDLVLAGLGMFGRPRATRVIWCGAVSPLPVLHDLQARVVGALRDAGARLEARPFHAHVTVGRLRPGAATDALVEAVNTPVNPPPGGVLRVDRLLLMRSMLTPDGPVYHPLHAARLMKNAPFRRPSQQSGNSKYGGSDRPRLSKASPSSKDCGVSSTFWRAKLC